MDIKDTYVRLLFIDYSSTFNTITPSKLQRRRHAPVYINGTDAKRMKSIKFLGVTITNNNLSWCSQTDVTVKKAQQHLFFLRQLRKFGMSIKPLTNFYRCTIESI
eukprot:g19532.t1